MGGIKQMRRASQGSWLGENKEKPHEGTFVGINLGADFVSEHEWGIKELYQCLGIDGNSNVMGIDRYKVGKVADGTITLMEEGTEAALVVEQPSSWNKREKIDDISRDLWLSKFVAINLN